MITPVKGSVSLKRSASCHEQEKDQPEGKNTRRYSRKCVAISGRLHDDIASQRRRTSGQASTPGLVENFASAISADFGLPEYRLPADNAD